MELSCRMISRSLFAAGATDAGSEGPTDANRYAAVSTEHAGNSNKHKSQHFVPCGGFIPDPVV